MASFRFQPLYELVTENQKCWKFIMLLIFKVILALSLKGKQAGAELGQEFNVKAEVTFHQSCCNKTP